ncbi:MAG: hypothetical protein JWM80_4325 [Cyanobacteria bacterium RYN_339]|nr:hypothetical protein [Cyanobacteria bacterium RYN_339]
MTLSPVSTVRPATVVRPAVASKPAAPTVVGAKAKARADWDRPDFTTIDGFKNYAVKWVGYVRDARGSLAVAQGGLTASKMALDRADAQYNAPVKDAQQALDKIAAQYQAPVDRGTRDLAAARDAMDLALHPGLARAQQLDAEAQGLASQIQGCENRLSDLRSRIANLDSRSSSYRYEASSLNSEISSVQREESTLSSRRYAVVQQANDQRAISADYNAPPVVAARQKVADLTNALEQAQTALRNQTAPYRDRLDSATQAYNHQMAASRAVVGDAQRKVDTAQAAATEAQNRLAHLGKEVGWWRKTWWKLTAHFDAGKFMDEQVKLGNA